MHVAFVMDQGHMAILDANYRWFHNSFLLLCVAILGGGQESKSFGMSWNITS